MRKDVKLGFAIGGVLLAVLVVYVLVISGDEKRPAQVTLATNNEPQTKKTEEPKTAAPIAAQPIAAVPPASAPSDAPKTEVTTAEPVTTTPPAVDPVSPTSAPAVASAGSNDHWGNGVLDTGNVPMMITTTPQPEPAAAPAPVPAEANRATSPVADNNNSGASSNRSAMVASGGSSSKPSELVKPVLAMTAGQTHVVQPNETFSSIAAAVYGSSAYYPHLIRANPTIDPRKLRAGMTINLPAVSDVRADNATAVSQSSDASARPVAAATAVIDSKTQYKVQSGDNLSKISIKLYGKPDRINKIYDLNKAAIGPDMAKVKAGMVLSLPEPPTAKMN